MNKKPFQGFPVRSRLIPLPELLLTRLLPEINSLGELRLILHIFHLLSQKSTSPKFVSYEELSADRSFLEGIEGEGNTDEVLCKALESAIDRGVLLHLTLDNEGGREDLYFINTEPNKRAVAKLKKGEISLDESLPHVESSIRQEKPNIFDLYEKNIGILSPMISEELREAEKLYPVSWIEEAFREAVNLNKRNWRYIARILERWYSEGKDSGEFRRHSKKEEDPDRYIKGRYGHVVRR